MLKFLSSPILHVYTQLVVVLDHLTKIQPKETLSTRVNVKIDDADNITFTCISNDKSACIWHAGHYISVSFLQGQAITGAKYEKYAIQAIAEDLIKHFNP